MGGVFAKSKEIKFTRRKKIIEKYKEWAPRVISFAQSLAYVCVSIAYDNRIHIGHSYRTSDIGVVCDDLEEILVVLNETLEILKPFPCRITIDLGEQQFSEKDDLKTQQDESSRFIWTSYANELQNFRGIITDKSYLCWDYYATEMQTVKGRRYHHVLNIEDIESWIKYHNSNAEQKSKCLHYYKDLFDAPQEEIDNAIFSISLASTKNNIKKMLYTIAFDLPLILAIKYEGILNSGPTDGKYRTHYFVLLFMFVTWGLDPNSDSIFKWFLIGHKLYDPRLLIFIANFIDEDLQIPVYENLRLDEVNGLHVRKILAISEVP